MDDRYSYRVIWSTEDGEHVGLCAEFPSLSWLAPTLDEAFAGIRQIIAEVLEDMHANGETPPEPMTFKLGVQDDELVAQSECPMCGAQIQGQQKQSMPPHSLGSIRVQ